MCRAAQRGKFAIARDHRASHLEGWGENRHHFYLLMGACLLLARIALAGRLEPPPTTTPPGEYRRGRTALRPRPDYGQGRGLVMDYYYDSNTVTTLWQYAPYFALSDNFFSRVSGLPP